MADKPAAVVYNTVLTTRFFSVLLYRLAASLLTGLGAKRSKATSSCTPASAYSGRFNPSSVILIGLKCNVQLRYHMHSCSTHELGLCWLLQPSF